MRAGAALYMRLSREDAGAAESVSIDTQRRLLRAWVVEHGVEVYDEYADDGYSGTSFERPAFRRMMRDMEAGRVHTVVTKDLSRLGRNSARVGDLLDEVFPRLRVRFIALSEGVDTGRGQGDLLAPLANAVNEWYARDISRKIRAALDVRRQNGEFIGSFAPYGYRKSPVDPHRLIPDEKAAAVVRWLFQEAATASAATLAARLNEAGVPTPLDHRCGGEGHRWTAGGVGKLLRNRCYLGHTEQGKSVKVSFKSRAVLYPPRDEWVVVENTHPPLVDEATFAAAQRPAATRSGFRNAWAGLVFCADCGRRMATVGTRRRGSPANLACGGYKAGGTAVCSNHHIDYVVFTRALAAVLRETVRLSEQEQAALARASGHSAAAVAQWLTFDPPDPRLVRALVGRVTVAQGTFVQAGEKRQRLRVALRFRGSSGVLTVASTHQAVSCVWGLGAMPPE